MTYQNIIFQIDQGVAVIKFNRPKALNAVNTEVLRELGQAMDDI
jgi:enoyl-CoA hydratase/carnithine racemase